MWFFGCDIGGIPCDMHLSLQRGYTPLMEAASEGHVECVKLLLERGARANHQNEVSAVYRVVMNFSCMKRA